MKYLFLLTLFLVVSCSSFKSPPRDSSEALKPEVCKNLTGGHVYKLTRPVPPLYPIIAIQKKQQGWALTQFTVNPDGSVTDVKVIDASPKGIFDFSAIKAASSFRYTPVIKDPKPTIYCNLFHYEMRK